MERDINDITQELSKVFFATFRKKHEKGFGLESEDTIMIRDKLIRVVELHSVKIEGDEISFRLYLWVWAIHSDEKKKLLTPTAKFSFTHFVTGNRNGMRYKDGYEIKSVTIEGLSDDTFINDQQTQIELANALFPDYSNNDLPVLMEIPTILNDKISNYASGMKGFASGISGNYIRMLYLSAVTITTLGYGDIVPVTTLSRLLVSIESVLGIVLIGLFLNALSFERHAPNRTIT